MMHKFEKVIRIVTRFDDAKITSSQPYSTEEPILSLEMSVGSDVFVFTKYETEKILFMGEKKEQQKGPILVIRPGDICYSVLNAFFLIFETEKNENR